MDIFVMHHGLVLELPLPTVAAIMSTILHLSQTATRAILPQTNEIFTLFYLCYFINSLF
jgi:hypothetical protein